MSLGPLFVDLPGTELTAADRELLCHPAVGGVVLFERNYESRAQLDALTAALHGLREPRLIVSVDHEGGKVQRFRGEFTRIPPMAALGALYDRDAEAARALAEASGWLLAAELLVHGVDLSFAPVLDLRRGLSSVIGDRALHADPRAVTRLGAALVRGMQRAGMAATGKHFPGHGGVREDSHLALPVDRRSRASLQREDLAPFVHLVRNGIPALMTAHVAYPEVDERPVCFSTVWLQQILRTELGFAGAVISDDLSMAGASGAGAPGERATAALRAGCDVVLVCNDRAGCEQAATDCAQHSDPLSQLRRVRLHGRSAVSWDELCGSPERRAVRRRLAELDDSPELDL